MKSAIESRNDTVIKKHQQMSSTIGPLAPLHVQLDPSQLRIEWPDGSQAWAADRLRQQCRCAECQRSARLGQPLNVPADIRLTDAAPVGEYGLQLMFSDGHARGIYPWVYLRQL